LHVINYPDSAGKACNLQINGFALPAYVVGNNAVPNFPNYDLGPLQGSGCDTIVTSASVTKHFQPDYKVSPNPARDWLNIIYNSNDDAMFELYDLYGRKVATLSLFHYFKNRLLHVDNLADGMYEWRVQRSGVILASGKVAAIK
jgi:Secretion system C-terminal sorting domain